MLAPFCTQGTSTDKLLTLRQACDVAQCHPNSIRNWDASGRLKCLRTPGGSRRVSYASLMALLGEQTETTVADDETQGRLSGPVSIAACIRVSSRGQALPSSTAVDKSSLDHQEGRVRAFLEERFRGQGVNVTWFKRVASGMDFNNAVFHRMVQGILEGKFKFLIATDFTRISRFGIQLIEYLCKLGGCEILYTLKDEAESKDENETLVDDVLSILQHYTSKVTGRKAKLIQEVKVEPAVLRRILTLHSEGQSTRAIARLLKRENITGTANGKAREITKTVVNRILKENGPLLKELCKNASSAFSRSNLGEFFAERVRVAAGDATIRLSVLVAEYRLWSFRRGEVPTANTLALPRFIESHFPTVQKGRLHKGQRFYKGLSLLAEKTQKNPL